MWRVGHDKSALQAPGNYSDHQDPRGRVDGDKIKLTEAIILPVDTGIRLFDVSQKITPQGASVGPRSKDNITTHNPSTGGSPRFLNSQRIDAELANLPPNHRERRH